MNRKTLWIIAILGIIIGLISLYFQAKVDIWPYLDTPLSQVPLKTFNLILAFFVFLPLVMIGIYSKRN